MPRFERNWKRAFDVETGEIASQWIRDDLDAMPKFLEDARFFQNANVASVIEEEGGGERSSKRGTAYTGWATTQGRPICVWVFGRRDCPGAYAPPNCRRNRIALARRRLRVCR